MPEETAFSRHFIEGEGHAYVEGVATGVYPKELKLANFTRRMLYLRPDLFLLVDELAAREPRLFQWRLASLGSFEVGPERGQFTLIKGEVALDIVVAWPPQWTHAIGETPLLGGYCSGMDYTVRYLGIEAPHKVWETTFVTLLTPRPEDRTPDFPQAEAVRENGLLGIKITHKGREWQVRMTQRDRTEERIEVVGS